MISSPFQITYPSTFGVFEHGVQDVSTPIFATATVVSWLTPGV